MIGERTGTAFRETERGNSHMPKKSKNLLDHANDLASDIAPTGTVTYTSFATDIGGGTGTEAVTGSVVRTVTVDGVDPGVDCGSITNTAHLDGTGSTVVLDSLCGSVGKLVAFLSGTLVETGAGFTVDELHQVFADRFRFESTDLIWDDHNRQFRFASSLMRRIA